MTPCMRPKRPAAIEWLAWETYWPKEQRTLRNAEPEMRPALSCFGMHRPAWPSVFAFLYAHKPPPAVRQHRRVRRIGAQVQTLSVKNLRFSWHRSCCMTGVPELSAGIGGPGGD